MIEKLDWDSAFFGYPVGRIFIKNAEGFDLDAIGKEFRNFKLVYMFSDVRLPQEYSNCLVDRKITFTKGFAQQQDVLKINEYDKEKDSYDELLDLAYLSGLFSRFKTDKRFKNMEFKRLYKQWIDRSINDTNIKVLVVRTDDSLSGFVTLEMADAITAKIGLISVGSNYQGKGFGSSLISNAERAALAFGRSTIQVVTQQDNKPAVRLYEKNGFLLNSLVYIYHFWN